jgi:hypothetical protein
MALSGHTGLAKNLRVRTAIEMIQNRDFYWRINNDPVWDALCPSYDSACNDCAVGNESSGWTLQALSSVVETPIIAIYIHLSTVYRIQSSTAWEQPSNPAVNTY